MLQVCRVREKNSCLFLHPIMNLEGRHENGGNPLYIRLQFIFWSVSRYRLWGTVLCFLNRCSFGGDLSCHCSLQVLAAYFHFTISLWAAVSIDNKVMYLSVIVLWWEDTYRHITVHANSEWLLSTVNIPWMLSEPMRWDVECHAIFIRFNGKYNFIICVPAVSFCCSERVPN